MYDFQTGLWEPDDPTSLPSGTERLLAEQVLTSLSTELAVRLLRIRETEQLLEEQKAEAATLEREIAHRRFYLAPIRRLPPDVLGDVVVLLSEEDRSWRDVWRFSWVCRVWRSATMARPSAWSRITIGIPRCRNPVELAKAASRYARGCDIDLYIDSRLNKLDAPALLSILNCRPKRVTSLYLTLRDILADSLEGLRPYPNLRRISLSTRYAIQTKILDSLVPRRHRGRASAKTFELHLDRTHFISGAYPRVLAKLRVLSLAGCLLPALEEFTTALSGSSMTLQSLSMCHCDWTSTLPPTRIIDFPALRKLRWIPTRPRSGSHILEYIRMQHLTCYTGTLSAWLLAGISSTPNIGTLGIFLDRMVPQVDDFRHSVLEQSLSQCHTLTFYTFFVKSSDLDVLLVLISMYPHVIGSSATRLNILYYGPATCYGPTRLQTVKRGLDRTGREIEVAFYDWTPGPLDERPWGMFDICSKMVLTCFADLEELTPMRYCS
jgi:hypothetical protein